MAGLASCPCPCARPCTRPQVVAITGRLLKAAPQHLEALVLRGSAYFYLHDHDLAKRHYGEALNRDPECKEAMAMFKKVWRVAQQQRPWLAAVPLCRAWASCVHAQPRADTHTHTHAPLCAPAGQSVRQNTQRRAGGPAGQGLGRSGGGFYQRP